eukprot:gnl/TRDRNA2_/TRDRNA2_84395_c0_seq1.p1 gnl/TRDRNA2_/TRDRNA2_84395_c0~~gnl/TRDRNA2_/TRDRNA2_84395_c0_seq1.p1  ORF type:complete len:348 (-),score=128.31 gnl/TRDRNA2_/TRDRNA2_84395_c0_seq1:68-1111(-)
MQFMKVATCLALGTFAFAAEMDSMAEDPALVQQALNDMMSQANGNLAQAERHHKHAVNRGKKAVKKQFAQDAVTYGNMVGDYVIELQRAENELQSVLNDTKAAMAWEAKQPHKDTDWQDPSFLETAKLSAQVGAAERTLKKMQHRRERAMRTAENQVESPMEDESSELGMKLGDLTEFLETAKTNFEGNVTARIANATSPLKVGAKKVEKKVKEDAVARIESLEKNLAEQTKKSQAQVTAANKNFNVLIAKEAKDMENKTKTVKANLEVSEDKELKFVGSLKPPPALLVAHKKNGTKATSTTKKSPAKMSLSTKKAAATPAKKANLTAAKNVSVPKNVSAPKKALRH